MPVRRNDVPVETAYGVSTVDLLPGLGCESRKPVRHRPELGTANAQKQRRPQLTSPSPYHEKLHLLHGFEQLETSKIINRNLYSL